MGNCQATADAEAVVIYHPGSGCDRSYKIYLSSSVAAEEIMVSYPGYYVALVGTVSTEEGIRLKQIKLLRPRETLSVGSVYRLISFEDVLLELSAKTRGKLVVRGGGDEVEKEGGGRCEKKGRSRRTRSREPRTSNSCSSEVAEEMAQIESSNTTTTSTTTSSSSGSNNRMHGRQWRPSLESISEFGVCEAQ